MRFITYHYIIILCFAFNVHVHAQEQAIQYHDISVEYSASDNLFIISGSCGLLNQTANKETGQPIIQRLLPSVKKFTFSVFSTNEYAEQNRKNKVAHHILIAKNQVIRLEGTDIIHPFNYFW